MRPDELTRFARHGVGVAHCPASNLRLGAGVAPVREMLDAGVHVGLGVDGSASNERSDLMYEVKQALLVARGRGGPRAMTAREALRLGTRGGAAVLGRDDIGSLEAGKRADIAVWRTDGLELAGAADPVAGLVLSGPHRADRLFVGGVPSCAAGTWCVPTRTRSRASSAGRRRGFDAPGITTYSILGADYGYVLLRVLGVATLALTPFHQLGARMGVVTGQGLTGLIRERYGVRLAALGVLALLVANIGTTCAEFAGVAASLDLAGVSRYASVPVAALAISALVLLGSFHRVEHVFLLMSTLLATYIVAAFVTGPDWGAAVHGLVVPSVPATRAGLLAITATVGTTLAPWGLAFIQSYAADKKLSVTDLRYVRIDVVTGALMTGVIGFFVVVTCADTLHQQGASINDAGDAASALEPLAGRFASVLFGAGLLGASVLAASILPLATAYSVSEVFGQ